MGLATACHPPGCLTLGRWSPEPHLQNGEDIITSCRWLREKGDRYPMQGLVALEDLLRDSPGLSTRLLIG